MKTTRCPMCKSNINLRHKPWKGQFIDCPSCEAVLEVVRLNPLELDWTYGVNDSSYDDSFSYEELNYMK